MQAWSGHVGGYVNHCRLRVVSADITECGAEALVSSSDFRMLHEAGVSKAICVAGGKLPPTKLPGSSSGSAGDGDVYFMQQYRIAQEVQQAMHAQGLSECPPLSSQTEDPLHAHAASSAARTVQQQRQ